MQKERERREERERERERNRLMRNRFRRGAVREISCLEFLGRVPEALAFKGQLGESSRLVTAGILHAGFSLLRR